MIKRLKIATTEFIFETIKMLTLESKIIQHKIITMFEFGLFTK